MGDTAVTGHGALMLVGPSQIGKDSLISRLTLEYEYERLLNTTTRVPRETLTSHPEYEFITVDRFHQRIRENAFVDWDYYVGNYYGVRKTESHRRPAVMHCGARMSLRIATRHSRHIPIFLKPTDVNSHKERIRSNFKKVEAQARLCMMEEELKHVPLFNHVVEVHDFASSDDVLAQIVAIHRAALDSAHTRGNR